MKRVFAVLLAVLMIVALVGCGKEKREVIKLTLSTEDAEAILPPPESCCPRRRVFPAREVL